MRMLVNFSESSQKFKAGFGATGSNQFDANFEVGAGGEETVIHGELLGRDAPEQHPISAITGLEDALKNAGTKFVTDETLSLSDRGVLSVNTAKEPNPDNTLPITSAAVAQTVGNIEILLKTI